MRKKIVTCLITALIICSAVYVGCCAYNENQQEKKPQNMVIMKNVKEASKKIDDRQLVISSMKKIKLKTKEVMNFGFLGNESVITSEKFDTDTLVITNLLNGNTEKKTIQGAVQYCVNGRLLVSNKTYDYIYDLNTGKKTDIISKGSMSQPVFADSEGKYVVYDDGKNYIIFNIDSKKSYRLKSKFDPVNVFGFVMYMSFSDDGKSVFYPDGEKILRSDLADIDNTTVTVADFSKQLDIVKRVNKIKGEDGAIITYEEKGESLKTGYYDFNSKQLKPIVNSPENKFISGRDILSNKSGSSTRVVYSEKINSNKMKICIGELKKGCLIKTTDLCKIDYDEVKETSWISSWSEDGTRIYLLIYDNNGIKADYLITIK